jgi:hypothetical protein
MLVWIADVLSQRVDQHCYTIDACRGLGARYPVKGRPRLGMRAPVSQTRLAMP